MNPFRLCGAAVICAAVVSSFSPAHSAEMTLSGTVFDVNNQPIPGVIVSLARSGESTTTDALGSWSLGSSTVGIRSRGAVSVAAGRLMLENGRLSVCISGRNISGRVQRGHLKTSGTSVSAMGARASNSQDTLLYSFGGAVRLRDTVSESQTGLVRVLDTTFNASVVYGYLTDNRDGQTYRTVKIGTQTWLAHNLNYRNTSGSSDTVGVCPNENGALKPGKSNYCFTYGRLYTWAEAMGATPIYNDSILNAALPAQGICPSSWHVPSAAEWTKLTDTTLEAPTAGTQLKANSTLWYYRIGTDTYGFRGLPAGFFHTSFSSEGSCSYWWTASEGDASLAWQRNMTYISNESLRQINNTKAAGASLRCVKN